MAQPRTELARDLSLLDVTLIGVGAMIGAGIFVLTGEAAGVAGPALVLSFALNGVVTLFTAMVYAELGSAIPDAGGPLTWGAAGGFIALLGVYTGLALSGVECQNREVESLLAEREADREAGDV